MHQKKCFIWKQAAVLDWPVKMERKQDMTVPTWTFETCTPILWICGCLGTPFLDFKTRTILVCMIKGSNWLWSTWIHSCFLSFLTGQFNIAGCFYLSVCVGVSVYCRGEVEDYIKCELISKGSSRHKHYLTCSLLLYTVSTYAMYCCYCDHTHIHHVVRYKIVVSYCYCWLHPCRISYSLLRGLG